MRALALFGALLAGVAAQRSGDTSYHDGAAINRFSIGLADSGVIRAEPAAVLSGELASVYASVAPAAVRPCSAAAPARALNRRPFAFRSRSDGGPATSQPGCEHRMP